MTYFVHYPTKDETKYPTKNEVMHKEIVCMRVNLASTILSTSLFVTNFAAVLSICVYLISGKSGIRTLGGVTLAGFQDQCHKPLDQLSRISGSQNPIYELFFVFVLLAITHRLSIKDFYF